MKKILRVMSNSKKAVKRTAANSLSSSKRRKHIEIGSESIQSNVPEDFEKAWKCLTIMRSDGGVAFPADVDTMGCESWHRPDLNEFDARFSCLVSLMLSSMTKDVTTSAAMDRLKKENLLNAKRMAEASEKRIGEVIYGVGFWQKKAGYLKKAAIEISNRGDVPDTLEALIALNGVGKKMAMLYLNSALNRCEGIGVDVHVHRISQRIGWTNSKATTPGKTADQLESWLPREYWSKINKHLVGLGQTLCTAKSPDCSRCLLQPYCKTGRKKM